MAKEQGKRKLPVEMCQYVHRCGNEAEEEHTCPYSEDIAGDFETLCNCCVECQNSCTAEI